MKININNHHSLGNEFADMLKSLTLFAKDRLSIEKMPSIFFRSDKENAKETLGKTAYYNPELGEIHVFVDERHAKDILRSIAHELVHHMQNEKGTLLSQDTECGHPDWEPACVKNSYHGDGYAQKNPHLRNMEKEAYLKGNMCFRDWEDSYKTTNYSKRGKNMSLKEWKNNELNRLMMKKFGLLKEDTNVEEAHCAGRHDEDEEKGLNEVDADGDGAPAAPKWSDKGPDKPDAPPAWADEDDNDPKVGDSLEEIIYQEVIKMLGGE